MILRFESQIWTADIAISVNIGDRKMGKLLKNILSC